MAKLYSHEKRSGSIEGFANMNDLAAYGYIFLISIPYRIGLFHKGAVISGILIQILMLLSVVNIHTFSIVLSFFLQFIIIKFVLSNLYVRSKYANLSLRFWSDFPRSS